MRYPCQAWDIESHNTQPQPSTRVGRDTADALVLGKGLSKLVPIDLCLQRWGCHMDNEFQVVGMERQNVRRERHICME